MKYFKRNRSRLFQATVVGMGHGFYCVNTLIPVPDQCMDDADNPYIIVNSSNYSAVLGEIKNKEDLELFIHLFKRGYQPVSFTLSVTDIEGPDYYFDKVYFKRNRIKKQTSKKKRYYSRRINLWNIIKHDLAKNTL